MGQIYYYEHPNWTDAIYWDFDPESGWDSYHQSLDAISAYIRDKNQPAVIVFHPEGDIPKGNPIMHMRRIIKMSKENENVLQTIIIMGADWIFAKAFVSVLSKMMSLEPEVKLVFSVEEARATYQETISQA